MPAIFFRYELSPIRIQYTYGMQPVADYSIKVCAIIGGVYVVSSIFESLLRNSISIFGFGEVSDPRSRGQPIKKVRKVIKKPM